MLASLQLSLESQRKERSINLSGDGFSLLPVPMLPAAASLAGLREAGKRSGRETEQLPQQQLKMHHPKGCRCEGARSWPCSPDGPAGPLPPLQCGHPGISSGVHFRRRWAPRLASAACKEDKAGHWGALKTSLLFKTLGKTLLEPDWDAPAGWGRALLSLLQTKSMMRTCGHYHFRIG